MAPITADEIVTVVEYFGAAWPWAEWSEPTMAVWIDGLADPALNVDGAVALHVARRCARKWDRPGSMAEFLSEYRTEVERRKPTTRAIEAAPTDRQGYQRYLAAAREAITRSADNRHWHGGPEPCEVCGGLAGTIGDQR